MNKNIHRSPTKLGLLPARTWVWARRAHLPGRLPLPGARRGPSAVLQVRTRPSGVSAVTAFVPCRDGFLAASVNWKPTLPSVATNGALCVSLLNQGAGRPLGTQ